MWGGWGKPQNPAAPLSAAAGSGRGRYDYPLCKEVYNAFVCRTLSVLHDRWDIARHVLDAYPDPQYRAEEAFYCFLTTAFASLVNDEIPWDDLHTRWTIADVLLEAVVNLVPEAVEEVSE